MNFADPSGTSYVDFTGAGTDAIHAMCAWADGVNTFVGRGTPFADMGYYNPNESWMGFGRDMGKVSTGAMALYLGGKAVGKVGAWRAAPLAPVAVAEANNLAQGPDSGVLQATCEGPGEAATGTVWDSIQATQPNWAGTQIPRSFIMNTPGGDVWVAPNATKHLVECWNGGWPIAAQCQMASLNAAVGQAFQDGIVYDQDATVGDWTLTFGAPGQTGVLPALYHATYGF